MMLNEPPSAAAAGQRLINVQEPLRELNSFQSSLVTTAGGSSKAHGCATFGYQASAIKTSLWEPTFCPPRPAGRLAVGTEG
mmetsp:Transcript_155241/g.274216  ORF Transcript_155241/g.274216 Transcript_155241/m.274216 type:complete len:81 (-) Transcript_155241:3064-3306(-)